MALLGLRSWKFAPFITPNFYSFTCAINWSISISSSVVVNRTYCEVKVKLNLRNYVKEKIGKNWQEAGGRVGGLGHIRVERVKLNFRLPTFHSSECRFQEELLASSNPGLHSSTHGQTRFEISAIVTQKNSQPHGTMKV